MNWWPVRKRENPKPQGRVVVPFPPGTGDLPVMKHHGLRALCGMFMDRHSSCKSPHPFCGNITDETPPAQLIAHVISQVDEDDGATLVAIYFSLAEGPDIPEGSEPVEPFEYAAGLRYTERTPSRKLVVQLMSDGTYIARYGSIANPVGGDYSTGRLGRSDVRTLYCDPEPSHARWQDWPSRWLRCR